MRKRAERGRRLDVCRPFLMFAFLLLAISAVFLWWLTGNRSRSTLTGYVSGLSEYDGGLSETVVYLEEELSDPLDWGIPSDHLPSLEELRLCEMSVHWPLERDLNCNSSTSCISCLQPQHIKDSDSITEAFAQGRPALLSKLEQWFPPPNTSSTLADPTITVLAVSSVFLKLLINWLCSCVHLGLSMRERVLFVGLDNITVSTLQQLDFRVVAWHEVGVRTGGGNVLQPQAKAAMILITKELLEMGYHVLYHDVDIVWLRDPYAYFKQNAQVRYSDVCGLYAKYNVRTAQGPLNGGFLRFRSNVKTRLLLRTMVMALPLLFYQYWVPAGNGDQVMWNTLLKHHFFRSITVTVLPSQIFPMIAEVSNGEVDVEEMYSVVVHAVSMSGEGKEKTMKRLNMWFADESCTMFNEYQQHQTQMENKK